MVVETSSRRLPPRIVGLAVGTFLAASATDASAAPSRLWGDTGERWDPHGRLPDFSHAGYRAGREPIPELAVVTNVIDFGAVGDGVTDDTAAFAAAIEATVDGALMVPEGRYLVRDILRIERDDVVIRGEGPGTSVLYIDRSLTDINDGVWSASFSWSGGFLVLQRSMPATNVGGVIAPAERGHRWLELETTEGIAEGSLIMLRLTDDAAGSLGWHMHNDQAEAQRCNDSPVVFNWRARIAHVDAAAHRVELDDPLPVDVRLTWTPTVQVLHVLSGSGIEGLTIEFPTTTYPGHLNELGYNAIALNGVVDAWVRDVEIINADSGIFMSGKHITIEDIRFAGNRTPDANGNQGHHAVGSSQSCLFSRLRFDADYVHGVTVSHQAARNVFTGLSGSRLVNLDHHRRTPIENLFTAFEVQWNYRSGGNGCEGPHSGARSTYWGLPGPMPQPCNTGGSGQCWGHIQSNVVGELAMSDQLTDDREWYENVAELEPLDLYQAQLERRLAIEDREARFSPLRFGLRSEWDENDRFRWAVMTHDGDERYFLATTVHRHKEGERLGEYTLARTPALGDVTVTAQVKSNEKSDNSQPDICLIVGYQDDENYEYAMFNGDAASSAIFAVRDGQRVELVNADRALLTDAGWHEATLRRTGDVLEMLWDGEVVASTESVIDIPAPIAGRVGVGTYNDSAWFDDIDIESPDLPEEPDPDGGTTDGGSSGDSDDDVDGSSGGTGGGESTTPASGDDLAGCGCRPHGAPPSWTPLGLLLVLLGHRRRRSAPDSDTSATGGSR